MLQARRKALHDPMLDHLKGEERNKYLEEKNSKKITIPYAENRAAIFNSSLFHETDTFSFKAGYVNRRINITMLFGKRKARRLTKSQPIPKSS